jgi:hypothetical protein
MPYQEYWERHRLKNGGWSKRVHCALYAYSKVDRCEMCCRMSSIRWVRRWWYRSWTVGMAVEGGERAHEPVLCLGCFNRVRPIWHDQLIAEENGRLLCKLERVIREARRHQNHGSPTPVPDRSNGRRPVG